MDLSLNNQQKLICHKTKTNVPLVHCRRCSVQVLKCLEPMFYLDPKVSFVNNLNITFFQQKNTYGFPLFHKSVLFIREAKKYDDSHTFGNPVDRCRRIH